MVPREPGAYLLPCECGAGRGGAPQFCIQQFTYGSDGEYRRERRHCFKGGKGSAVLGFVGDERGLW